MAEPMLMDWLRCGNKFQVWAWRRMSRDGRGTRKVWRMRTIEVFFDEAGQLESFERVPPPNVTP